MRHRKGLCEQLKLPKWRQAIRGAKKCSIWLRGRKSEPRKVYAGKGLCTSSRKPLGARYAKYHSKNIIKEIFGESRAPKV